MDVGIKLARKEAWFSLFHKLGIVAVGLLAYGGLVWLGQAKDAYVKDENKKWQLTRANLEAIADAAERVAPGSQTSLSGTDTSKRAVTADPKQTRTDASISPNAAKRLSDSELLRDIATNFKDRPDVSGRIASKQELIVAVEQIIDARIWRDAALRISETANPAMPEATMNSNVLNPSKEKKNRAVDESEGQGTKTVTATDTYLDRVALEDSLARSRVAGTHALVEASATQIEKQAIESTPPLRSIFDEKKPLYVLFEIGWYFLLALAVLSSSWLLLTLFTVLPFTDAQGYWTKRIGDLLEKFAPGMAMAAVPVTSAALVAATMFAGTAFATNAGGYARAVTSVVVTNTDLSTHVRNESPAAPPDLKDLKTHIDTILRYAEARVRSSVEKRAKQIDIHLDKADAVQQDTATHVRKAEEKAAAAEELASAAVGGTNVIRFVSFPGVRGDVADVQNTLGPKRAPQSVFDHVSRIASALKDDKKQLSAAKDDIDTHDAIETHARNAQLADAAIIDTRPLWRRFLGRTQFLASPGAAQEIAAYLHVRLDRNGQPLPYDLTLDKVSCAEYRKRAGLVALLNGAASVDGAKPAGEFRDYLHGLAKNKNIAEYGDVGSLLDNYDQEILRVCAVPRY